MLPNTGNILDQLIGGFDIAAPNASGKSGKADGTGLFGSIFAGAMGSGINSTGEENCAQPQMLGIPLAGFGQLLGIIDPQAAAEPTVQIGEGTSAMPNTVDLTALDESGMAGIDGESATALVESDPTLDFNISNQQLRMLLAASQVSQPTALEAGTYRITDCQLNGSQLELTVTSDQTPGPIQISIPAELLDAATLKATGQTGGGLLNQTATETDQLNQLLGDLKLKTLEVKLEPTSSSRSEVSQPVEVKLVAENSGQEVVIRTNIVAQQIKAPNTDNVGRKTTDAAQDADVNTDDADGETDARSLMAAKSTRNTNPLLNQTETRTMRAALVGSRFDLPERLAQNKQNAENQLTANGDATLTKFSDVTSATADRTGTAARLTLPDSAAQQLRPNGQSVMLKIEPEHLGPARLNLTLNNQTLTARVTVDSPAAKVAVENSLDQLNSQLSKVGIQVDRIEVTLSGGGAQERFFERRPQWSSDSSSRYRSADDDSEIESVMPSTVNASPARQYLNAGGVNLWA